MYFADPYHGVNEDHDPLISDTHGYLTMDDVNIYFKINIIILTNVIIF
jgi:hypothetical protein